MLKSHERFHSVNGKRMILVADDESINREILREILQEEYELLFAADGLEALKKIRENAELLSLVLLDLMMPGLKGLDLLKIKQGERSIASIPVIVMTSDAKAEIESLNLGAGDFIPKPYPGGEIILARVRRIIELSEDRQTIYSTERDPLTDLYNREYFFTYAKLFDHHHKDRTMDAIVIDVNHFHMINERHGRAYGDDVLCRIGQKVRAMVKDDDGIVCRREADTFLIYCPHREDYEAILDHVSAGLLEESGEAGTRVRLRMGVYAHVDKSVEMEHRFDRAKMAADKIRNNFTKSVAFYDQTLYDTEMYTEQLIEDFPEAIHRRQFRILYQPKYDIRGPQPVLSSAEALVRWQHPGFGMLTPDVFIPLFEENGMIQQLDRYVWEEAARQICDWKERYGITIPVSVNVSRVDMFDVHLAQHLKEIVERYGIDPPEFHLEVTESAYTDDSDLIISAVRELRELGFFIEMDDFGTGYSSLGMLSNLPIDALKMDMIFVRNAFGEKQDVRMLELIMGIADHLSVPIIAEGVETEEQMLALKTMGCGYVQGYYFSRPVPAELFDRLIEEKIRSGKENASQAANGHEGEDASFRSLKSILQALAQDFFTVYYVNTETLDYVEYGMDGDESHLKLIGAGENFFSYCKRDIPVRVLPEDRERVLQVFDQTALLREIADQKTLSLRCRMLVSGQPVHVSVKVQVPEGDPSHIVIGMRSIEAQVQRELDFAEAVRTGIANARIAQALAADYFSIYYVDLDTEQFSEFTADSIFQQFGFEKDGSDFFSRSRKNILCVIDPEDREYFLEAFTREKILKELDENGAAYLTYRLMLDGVSTYMRLKATRMEDENGLHLIIGVSNVDSQIRQEQEHARKLSFAREIANRDALTGVKSKHAYVEKEKQIDQAIRVGEINPFSVIVCDVNGLKEINDTRGHMAGDQYLKEACQQICNVFDHSPVYRIGGDEFVVVTQGRDNDAVSGLVHALTAQNCTSAAFGNIRIACGCSSFDPRKDKNLRDVFDRADAAMYENKKTMKGVRTT